MSGGAKETPRQKMIGMMYLAYTAMLALNVSAEVLNAFKLFESGLSQTVVVFDEKNNATQALFEQANRENQERIAPWLKKAMLVREKSKQMMDYLDGLKVDMVKLADGEDAEAIEEVSTAQGSPLKRVNGDKIVNLSTVEPSSDLMVRQQKGLELKNKLIEYRKFLLGYVDAKSTGLRTNVENMLATNDVKNSHGDGQDLPWEIGTFTDLPIIAAVPILTNIQVNILTCESDMMNYLLQQADVGTVKIDHFDPVVLSISGDYVLRGSRYEANIFLAASDKTLKPDIMVNGQKLKTVDGTARYEASTNSVGEQMLKGIISLNGKQYPFTHSYVVGEPSAVVSATKMNVLYRGVPNPIEVSAAGVQDSKLQINVSNGKLIRSGTQYTLNPGDGATCEVNVLAEVNGDKQVLGKKIFRVKNVPKPDPEIDGITGRTATRAQLSASQGIRAVMPPDFDFDLKFTVKSFTLSVTVDGYVREAKSNGMMFSAQQKQIIGKVQAGARLGITDIVAVGPDGRDVALYDLMIKIR